VLTGKRDATLRVNKGDTKSCQKGTALEPSKPFKTVSVAQE